ncbi:leucine-rich repeat protein [uncultured Eubacterium sp.]|uniref:leucine-rich repeat protein n=1 Tax=uncultured Eubacterium sp. TaxID=165185 RepID=UPI0015C069EA|nr:leucine-rich repeat protein [uncultured Eubacterium sp.]
MRLKTNGRKILSCLLVLMLVLCMLPTGVVGYALSGDYTFSSSTGELIINTAAGVTAWESDVNSADIKSVTVRDSVTEIKGKVFQDLTNLEAITFDGAISIESETLSGETFVPFNNTVKLSNISFGGAATIGTNVFKYTSEAPNTALTELYFPANSTVKGSNFSYCSALEKTIFEDKINICSGGSFFSASALKTIEFKGTSVIGSGNFQGENQVDTLTFGGKTEISGGMFNNLSHITELTFPTGSTLTSSNFYNCPALEKVTFEGDVDLTAGSIFGNSTALKEIVFNGKSKIANSCFSGSSNLEKMTFGDETEIKNGVFPSLKKLKELTFPAGSVFGPGIFNNTSIEKITFEGDVDLTAGGVFSSVPSLKTLIFKGESKLSNGCFSGTSNLEEISFGGKTEIKNGVLSGSVKLKELVFPTGSTFGPGIFTGCTAIEKVIFEGDVDLTAGGIFQGASALKTLIFKGESKLSNSSFSNAKNLKTITFAKKTSLGSNAFSGIGAELVDKTDVIVLPQGSTVSTASFNKSNIAGVQFMDKTPQTFEENTFYDCEDGAIIYVPCVSVAAYTTALNDGANPANPNGYAIVGVHTFVGGVCECGELAPVKPVTVNSGEGSGNYYEGAIVTIKANAPEPGKVFDKWEIVSGNITLDNATSATTTFVMPDTAVEVKAVYKNAASSHTHNANTSTWEKDESYHWNLCDCGEKLNKSSHTFEWIIDKEATETEKGYKHQECTVCGYSRDAVEISTVSADDMEDTVELKSEPMTSPQTGYDGTIWMLSALMIVSGLMLAGFTLHKKKRAK